MVRKARGPKKKRAPRTWKRQGVLPKDVEARYDSAITTPENARHWAMADSLSADASLAANVRRTVRERARYEVGNNSYAKGLVLTVTDDCIGTGPRLQLFGDNQEWNQGVERDFASWAAEIKLAEKLRTMRMAKAVDGEAFAMLATNTRLNNPVKLDLIPFETDRVADPILDTVTKGNVDGIRLDENGYPVAYSILTVHPGDPLGALGEYVEVDAANIVHWFRADRPEQHRGLSELTPALPLFAQLRRYTLAVLGAAETAADFAAVLYTDAPAGGEAMEAQPFDTISLEKRMATTLPDGWKLNQVKAEQPTTTYPDFKREVLGEIARCLQVPVNIVSGDSSKHNYASGRLDHQTYYRSIRIEQHTCSSVVLDKVFAAWVREYSVVRRGNVNFPFGNAVQKIDQLPHLWFWDGFEHVDPLKEATAQATRLASMTTTLAAEYAKQGKDWEIELTQIAKERAMMKELGLTMSDVASVPQEGDEEYERRN